MPDGNQPGDDETRGKIPSNPPRDIGPASGTERDVDPVAPQNDERRSGADGPTESDADETATTSAIAPSGTQSTRQVRAAVLEDVRDSFDDRPDDAFPGRPSDAFIETEFFDFGYLEAYEEVDRYWVNRPYAYVTILYDEATNTNRYHVVEPDLDEFEDGSTTPSAA
ncbi:hypothetical protein [Haloterrigena alkaliphila]|uniref:hypothetical protein n=1 Tax=Haloterrigena alkaliphila TaxID=2816475 RepID=UPI001CEC411D|nr:hypothetical protein [Haloterrigena alkaliphila]UHQ95017.1 hypothetical protein J0X25_14240 [Haloterrigena alkaliphila]